MCSRAINRSEADEERIGSMSVGVGSLVSPTGASAKLLQPKSRAVLDRRVAKRLVDDGWLPAPSSFSSKTRI